MERAPIPSPKIVITGVTGWIGTAMLANIASFYGPGWNERLTLFGSSNRTIDGPDNVCLQIIALEEMRSHHLDDAIVVHLAYLTKEKVESLGERAFTDGNLAIDDFLLDALVDGRPRFLFVASSGAAALAESGIDRHPYGLSKLRQEDRMLRWASQVGVPIIVGRIFNIAGPHINKVGSYALGSFIEQANATQQIHIKAKVPVFRSFLHVDDLCALVLAAGRQAYSRNVPLDLCGAQVVEMHEIAEAVSRVLASSKIEVSRSDIDWTLPSVYVGKSYETIAFAMEMGCRLSSFDQQVNDTVAWLNGHDPGQTSSKSVE